MKDDDKESGLTHDQIHGYLRGDKESTEALFLRFRESLLADARRHPLVEPLRDQGQTEEDLVHASFLELFERGAIDGFEHRGKGSFQRFLNRILDYRAIDLLRRETAKRRGGGKRPKRLDSSSATGAMDPAGKGPGVSTIVWMSDLIDRCSEKLEGHQESVWNLRMTEYVEFQEIGQRLGITPSAARGLFRRAVLKLLDEGLLEHDDKGSP